MNSNNNGISDLLKSIQDISKFGGDLKAFLEGDSSKLKAGWMKGAISVMEQLEKSYESQTVRTDPRPDGFGVGTFTKETPKPSAFRSVQHTHAFTFEDTRKNKVYIAGPMSGLPNYNFSAFHAAERLFKQKGFSVINPADHGVVDNASHEDYLRYNVARMLLCDTIAFLPGFEKSKGALVEMMVANLFGLKIQFISRFDYSLESPTSLYTDGLYVMGDESGVSVGYIRD